MFWLQESQNKMKELRKQRIEKGFTQENVANVLGWPISKVSKLESCKQEPLWSDIKAIEFVLKSEKFEFEYNHDRGEPAKIKGA